ncbi:MAG: N-acetylmuramoyl-L-alanine amidase [Scytonema sp. CRU_2_7]|nr:N-acetylmuramoyl-L-alanine amidase [Scytonema sp. CRU_2_7]
MQGSKYQYLQDINKIVLCAGHGGDNSPGNNYDPGSTNGQRREADENIYLTKKIAQILREMGLSVDEAPHNLNLQPTINWLNQTYPNWTSNSSNKAWVIEIHRDWNNPNMEEARKNDQCGIYYWGRP